MNKHIQSIFIACLVNTVSAGPPSNKTGFAQYGAPPYTMSCGGVKDAYEHSQCCGKDGGTTGFAPEISDCRVAIGHGIQVISTEFLHVPVKTNPRVLNTAGALDMFQSIFYATPEVLDMPLGEVGAMLIAGDFFNWFTGPKEWRTNFMYLTEAYTGTFTNTTCTKYDWTNFTKLQECDPVSIDSMLVEIAPTCAMIMANMHFQPYDPILPFFGVLFDSFRMTFMVNEETCPSSIAVPNRTESGAIIPGSMINKTLDDTKAVLQSFNTLAPPRFDFRMVPFNGINRCMKL